MKPSPPIFPRLTIPPPAYGSPEWQTQMQRIVAYVDESCAYHRARRKPPPLIGPLKPGPWWRPPGLKDR